MTKLGDGIISFNNSVGEAAAARQYRDNKRVTDSQLDILYANDWVVQKFIDNQTTDMVRIDREVKSELDPKYDKEIESFCKRFDVFGSAQDYLKWGRLYGDSIVMAVTQFVDGVDDEVDITQPLNLDTEKLVKFIVLDKKSYTPSSEVITDISSSLFAMPFSYELKIGEGQVVHHSRVQRLSAGEVPLSKRIKGGRQSMGVTEVKGIWDALIAYNSAKVGISDLIEKCKVFIMPVEGFNVGVADGREEDYVRIADAVNKTLSSANMAIVDSTAKLESVEVTSTWVNDALRESRTDLAGACRMPLTRLFGQAAGGFASGEEDNKIYYEYINSKQESMLRPFWNFVDKFLIDHLRDKFADFTLSSFDYDFPSIRDRDEKELAEIANLNADYYSKLFDMDVVNSLNIAKDLRNKGFLPSVSDDDLEKLKAIINDPTYTKPTQESEAYQRY